MYHKNKSKYRDIFERMVIQIIYEFFHIFYLYPQNERIILPQRMILTFPNSFIKVKERKVRGIPFLGQMFRGRLPDFIIY